MGKFAEWSFDGKLAFLTGDTGRTVLKIWMAGQGDASRITLSETLTGGSAVSWSADSMRVTVGTNQGVAIVETATGNVQHLSSKGIPQFAPGQPDLLAVLDRGGENTTLTIFRRAEKIAARSFPDSDPASFVWSPDNEWLATSSDREVAVWNWRTDESRVIARSGVGGFTRGIAWMPD